jgi:hypothetical protein
VCRHDGGDPRVGKSRERGLKNVQTRRVGAAIIQQLAKNVRGRSGVSCAHYFDDAPNAQIVF